MVGGAWHKRCTGSAHEEPVYLPATTKYFHTRKTGSRAGQFLSHCRLCENWHKLKSPGSDRGLVEVRLVRHFYEEAVNRVGRAELERRTGIAIFAINEVLNGTAKNVRKANLKKVLLELISMRRKNEYHDNAQLRHQEKRRAKKRRAAVYQMRHALTLGDPEEHLAKLYPIKDDKPDLAWWVETDKGVLPRYGEEMLGSEF